MCADFLLVVLYGNKLILLMIMVVMPGFDVLGLFRPMEQMNQSKSETQPYLTSGYSWLGQITTICFSFVPVII